MAAWRSPCRSSTRRRDYFTNVISELLFWLGEDKLLFGSDYGIWTPKWLIDKFMAFEIPEEVTQGKPASMLTLQAKKKILGLNAARLYDIDVEAQKQKIAGGHARNRYARVSAGRETERARRRSAARCERVTDPGTRRACHRARFVTGWRCGRGRRVHIGFRLPTYWCAANFAFLMADDMRRAVGALPWVRRVERRARRAYVRREDQPGLAHGLVVPGDVRRRGQRRSATICAGHSWSRRFSAGRRRCCGILLETGHFAGASGSLHDAGDARRRCRSTRQGDGLRSAISNAATSSRRG